MKTTAIASTSRHFLICLSTIVLFSSVGEPEQTLLAQQGSVELSRIRIHEIAGMLPKQPSGFSRPCSDRAAWSEPSARLNGFMKAAQQRAANSKVVQMVLPANITGQLAV